MNRTTRHHNRIIVFVLALVAAAAVPVSAPSAPPLAKRIVLDSGMVVLLAERHDIPMVTVTMTFPAGSLVEPREKPGLASLTASLMMQGTTTRSAEQISREIDFIGGSLSVSGGTDVASASLRVLKKDVRKGFLLLADVLRNPAFDQTEIDRKVKEFLAEIRRQNEEPGTIADQAFAKAVFGDHPYGTTNDDLAASLPKLTRQDVIDFHRQRYGPKGTVAAVVGDVTESEVLALIRDFFDGWTSQEPRPVPLPAPPAIEKTRLIALTKDITQANIVMGHPGISRQNPDFYAVVVMNYILGGGGFSSRLMDTIRDTEGLAYSIYSTFDAQKEPGAFRVEVQTKNESANEAISRILKEIERIRTELVSERELADAKAYLTGSFPLRMDTYAKIAGILTSIELFGLGLDYPQKYPSLINAVTREDVQRAARKYLHPDRMIVVVVANQQKAKAAL